MSHRRYSTLDSGRHLLNIIFDAPPVLKIINMENIMNPLKTAPVILFFLLLVCAPFMVFAAEDAAMLMDIEGQVWMLLNDETDWGAAESEFLLQKDDSIRTGADGRARLVLEDKSVVVVGPLSVMKIESVMYDYATGGKEISLSLEKGKARAMVSKLSTASSSFEIRTPTAIAGVRGTDFAVEIDPEENKSTVTVFEGVVEVGGRIGAIRERVRVMKNQVTDVLKGGKPAAPQILDDEKLQKLNNLLSSRRKGGGGISEDAAAAVVTVSRSGMSGDKKLEIAKRLKAGELSPDQVRKIAPLSRDKIAPGKVEALIDIVRNNRISDGRVDELVARIRAAKDENEIEGSIEEFTDAASKEQPRGQGAAGAAGTEQSEDSSGEARPGGSDLREAAKDKKEEITDRKDTGKSDGAAVDDALRRDMQMINRAIEKGIPREKLEPIIKAIKNKLIDSHELGLMVKAIERGANPDYFKDLLEGIVKSRIDPAGRHLIFKALELGIDRKELMVFLDRVQAAEMTPQEIRKRVEDFIKKKLKEREEQLQTAP
ncbi:MAG TPA: FecR family protein [bacterium]|nr:FecR family protein [bacterium]